jgi:hypothetical protein
MVFIFYQNICILSRGSIGISENYQQNWYLTPVYNVELVLDVMPVSYQFTTLITSKQHRETTSKLFALEGDIIWTYYKFVDSRVPKIHFINLITSAEARNAPERLGSSGSNQRGGLRCHRQLPCST